jgi:hypothetical protein
MPRFQIARITCNPTAENDLFAITVSNNKLFLIEKRPPTLRVPVVVIDDINSFHSCSVIGDEDEDDEDEDDEDEDEDEDISVLSIYSLYKVSECMFCL